MAKATGTAMVLLWHQPDQPTNVPRRQLSNEGTYNLLTRTRAGGLSHDRD